MLKHVMFVALVVLSVTIERILCRSSEQDKFIDGDSSGKPVSFKQDDALRRIREAFKIGRVQEKKFIPPLDTKDGYTIDVNIDSYRSSVR